MVLRLVSFVWINYFRAILTFPGNIDISGK